MKSYLIAIILLVFSHLAYAPQFEIIDYEEAEPAALKKRIMIMKIQNNIDSGSNPNLLLSESHCALWYAANYGEYELARKLLELGANPDLKSTSQWSTTPLQQSLRMAKLDIFELLLRHNADPNKLLTTRNTCNTYLHWLCLSHNNLTINQKLIAAQLLFNYGAQTDIRSFLNNIEGPSVLEHARAKIPGSALLQLIEYHAKEFKLQKIA